MSSRREDDPPPTLAVVPGVDERHDGLPGAPGRDGAESPRRRELPVADLVAGVLARDRTVLGRAITLVESNAPAHQEEARRLLTALLPHAGRSLRLGVTGVPGAGKSTFVEALGSLLTSRGHRVAVTAVDPTSSVSGGSILGDKTRMERLSVDPNAFIRPSPSGGALGGVARKTRETIVVLEAAGHDVVLVETMGVGQSEIVVRSMVDFFLLLLVPGAGDELQGIKKGVVEMADAILVNKADGDAAAAAELARAEYERALHFVHPATEGWRTSAHTASALTGRGIPELWEVVESFRRTASASGALLRRRREQERAWVHALVEEGLRELFRRDPRVAALLPELEAAVVEGRLPASAAARRLLSAFQGGGSGPEGESGR